MANCIIILGMHRSGTSCLAGILRNAGVHFNAVQTQNTYNIKGNIENLEVVALNDAVMAFNDGTWDAPPDLAVWPQILIKKKQELIEKIKGDPFWGFKDPRTLFTLQGWTKNIDNFILLGTFRHPLAVISSLAKRNGFSERRSLELWKAYNLRLLALWRKSPFPMICFDLPPNEYLKSVGHTLKTLGLGEAHESLNFFDPELRSHTFEPHSKNTSAIDDPEAKAIYELLLRTSGLSAPSDASPDLSLVVVAYEMGRELPRTLASLAPGYQRGVTGDEYEVIVIDNGSPNPVDVGMVNSFGPNFRLIKNPNPKPSPCHAINFAASQARGHYIGVNIDGARILSPGILRSTLDAFMAFPHAVVATIGYHIGPGAQKETIAKGYNQDIEDNILANSGWEFNGYKLFDHSFPAKSAQNGMFAPIPESNCFFMPKQRFEALGGFEEQFDKPGGGIANHDMLARALAAPGTPFVILIGEATFHQIHKLAPSTTPDALNKDLWSEYTKQYQTIRGYAYTVPTAPPIFFGQIPPGAESGLLYAARQLELSLKEKKERRSELTWQGFYPGKESWRWMPEKGALTVKAGLYSACRLSFVLSCTNAEYYDKFPFIVRIYVNDVLTQQKVFSQSGQREQMSFEIMDCSMGASIELTAESSYVPAELGLSSDVRRLSVYASEVSVTDLSQT